MKSDQLLQRLAEFAELRFAKPDWAYQDNPDYHDPTVEVKRVLVQPRPCRYCTRECSGRYTFRRLQSDPTWRVHCYTCHRFFPLPKNGQRLNK